MGWAWIVFGADALRGVVVPQNYGSYFWAERDRPAVKPRINGQDTLVCPRIVTCSTDGESLRYRWNLGDLKGGRAILDIVVSAPGEILRRRSTKIRHYWPCLAPCHSTFNGVSRSLAARNAG